MYASVATSLLMAVAVMAQEGPRIETPASVIQCQPSRIQWAGGQPPYWITVIPAGQTSAAPIMTLADNTQDTSITWNVNLEPNTQVSLQIRDGTGAVQYSSPITVQGGSNSACMTQTAQGTDSAGAVAGASGAPTNDAGPASGSPSPSGGASQSPSGSPSAGGSPSGSPSASPSASGSPTGPGAQSSSARPTSSGGAANSGTAANPSASVATPSPTSGASAVNIPIVGAAAVAAAIMAYV